MNRIFAGAFLFLCIAAGALILFVAVFSTAPAGRETPQTQVAKDWTRFPPADRASCLRLMGSSGTYTDLLKCLEIKREARQLPKEPLMPSTSGQGGLP
jgi:hypothetical protein